MQKREPSQTWETFLSVVIIIAIAAQLILTSLIYREVRMLRAEQALAVGEGPSAGLPIGTVAPAFTLEDTQGQSVALADFRGQQVLMIFSSPDCPYCRSLFKDLHAYASHRSARTIVLMLSLASIEVNRQLQEQEQFSFPVLTATRDLFLQYEIPGTPFIYVIDSSGQVQARGAVNNLSDILTMVNE